MALYPNVYPFLSFRLGDSVGSYVPANGDFDGEISIQVAKVLNGYGLTYSQVEAGSYPNPQANDILFLNKAVALYTAIELIVPLSTGGLTGPISLQKLDSVETKFNSGSDQDERVAWKSEADQCIALISFVQTTAPDLTTFAVSENRRHEYGLWGNY